MTDPVHAAIRIDHARALAGAWADLDWEEALEELERIGHDNEPTPPIEALPRRLNAGSARTSRAEMKRRV